METISNAANSASKMIWGEGKTTESGQEPVSGEQGTGSKTEPFDQGNKDAGVPSSTEESLSAESAGVGNPGSGNPGSGDSNRHLSSTEESLSAESTGVGNPGSGDSAPAHSSSEGQTATSSTAVGDSGSNDPSTGSGIAERQTPVQKQQGADKPMDEPTTGEQKDAVKETKDEGEELMAKRDPNDHSGEPMKVHDGSEKKEGESDKPEGEKSLEDKSKEEGTGEKYVKSTGLEADGGDFDVTRPGAGAEANRLLEEKGIHKDAGNSGPPQDISGGSGGVDDAKAKPKLTEKLKEKLHIGKH